MAGGGCANVGILYTCLENFAQASSNRLMTKRFQFWYETCMNRAGLVRRGRIKKYMRIKIYLIGGQLKVRIEA